MKPFFAAVPMGYPFGTEISYEVIQPLFLVQPILSSLDSAEWDSTAPLPKVATAIDATALIEFLQANGLSLQDLELAAL